MLSRLRAVALEVEFRGVSDDGVSGCDLLWGKFIVGSTEMSA